MSDFISIKKLELSLKIGCQPEERINPQKVELDVELEILAKKAANSKNLTDTVCYLTLSQWYTSAAEAQEWVLIEELVESLAAKTLLKHSSVSSITLEARKFIVPKTESVGVRITRSRS